MQPDLAFTFHSYKSCTRKYNSGTCEFFIHISFTEKLYRNIQFHSSSGGCGKLFRWQNIYFGMRKNMEIPWVSAVKQKSICFLKQAKQAKQADNDTDSDSDNDTDTDSDTDSDTDTVSDKDKDKDTDMSSSFRKMKKKEKRK